MLPAFLQLRGLVKQHIDSYNYFLTVELKQILLANQKVHCDADPNFFLKYTDIRIGAPSVEEELVVSKTTPNECRLRDMTYAAPILVDVEYVRGRRLVKRQNVVIGRMPIMLRSCRCVLTDRTRGELATLQEWSVAQRTQAWTRRCCIARIGIDRGTAHLDLARGEMRCLREARMCSTYSHAAWMCAPAPSRPAPTILAVISL